MNTEEYLRLDEKAIKNCAYVVNALLAVRHTQCFYQPLLTYIYDMENWIAASDTKHMAASMRAVVKYFVGRNVFDQDIDAMAENDGEELMKVFVGICGYFVVLNTLADKSYSDSAGKLLNGYSVNPNGFLGYNGQAAMEGATVYQPSTTTPIDQDFETFFDFGGVAKENHNLVRVIVRTNKTSLRTFADGAKLSHLNISVEVRYFVYGGTGADHRLKYNFIGHSVKSCVLAELRNAMVEQLNTLEAQK